jgi:coenzyme F420-reducing hydrogenase alpha subunit
MHNSNFDLSVEEISKIEGTAGMQVKVREGKVEDLKLSLSDYKRFYTQAIRGKPISDVPQLLARICGTCSNAHLLCSIQSVEKAIAILPSEQTKLIRRLITNGLMIRDHGLHLYVFSLPDVLGRDSILEFDESKELEHQLLHDTFTVKAAGNQLSIAFGGRSVHAPYPMIGGFTQFPQREEIEKSLKLLRKARPAAVRLVQVFSDCPFEFLDETTFVALKARDYNFLDGVVTASSGEVIPESQLREHLEHTVIPYSQASGYKFKGNAYMVGALSRINLSKDLLHPNTRRDAGQALEKFPSKNVFHNNLAQAIEVLHCIDESLELLENRKEFPQEQPVAAAQSDGIGVGVIEAPRGLLYHRLEIKDRKVVSAEIVVPTGQNQISMEKNLVGVVEGNIEKEKDQISFEIEKFVRAYDPCISCATHFLKIRWL